MADSIFRPLANALPDAVFEMLQGIGEAAVAEARSKWQPWPHHRPSQTTQLREAMDGALGRHLCDRYGWKAATAWRSRDEDSLVIAARLACGHEHHMSIDELAIEASNPHGLLDIIDKRWLKSQKRYACYCVPRLGTVQV